MFGSVVKIPSTSVKIIHLSALKNLAKIIAVESDPPLPIVVILSLRFTPWKPVIIGTPPDFKYFNNLFLFIWLILENLCLFSVKIGICQAVHDLDFSPRCTSLPATSEHETCSPDDTNTSYSASEKLLLIFFWFFN